MVRESKVSQEPGLQFVWTRWKPANVLNPVACEGEGRKDILFERDAMTMRSGGRSQKSKQGAPTSGPPS